MREEILQKLQDLGFGGLSASTYLWSLGILGRLCMCILVLKGASRQLMGILKAVTCLQYAVRKGQY